MQLSKIALGCFSILQTVACASAAGDQQSSTSISTDPDASPLVVESRHRKVSADGGGADSAVADSSVVNNVPDASNGGSVWHPAPGTSWQWQLSGSLDTSFKVQMYDIDLFDNSANTIASIQNKGAKVICYLSAGSYEPGRPDSSQFPSNVLGNGLQGWPGEKWLDIRSSVVRKIMTNRMDLAVQKKCDGIEPDNVDGYANSNGFGLTAKDQLNYNEFLASEAHARNLSVALKNDTGQVVDLVTYFDFAINEQCFQYNECATEDPFINANKAVFEVEYGSPSLSSSVCPKANAANFDTLIKNLSLDAQRTSCR